MYSIHDPDSNDADIEDQAARWLARWNSGEMSKREEEDLERWQNASPAHREMYDDMRRVWAQMGLITTIIPEEALEKDRDPDILVKALEKLVSFGSTPQIIAFFISAAAILVFIG